MLRPVGKKVLWGKKVTSMTLCARNNFCALFFYCWKCNECKCCNEIKSLRKYDLIYSLFKSESLCCYCHPENKWQISNWFLEDLEDFPSIGYKVISLVKISFKQASSHSNKHRNVLTSTAHVITKLLICNSRMHSILSWRKLLIPPLRVLE